MIHLKTDAELMNIRKACQINAEVHKSIEGNLVPGIRTSDLNELAKQQIESLGGRASFPEQFGFPGAICVSVNDEVGHGVPGQRMLHDGDVVKIDIGVEVSGYHSDCAKTHIIGTRSPEKERLVYITKQALCDGLSMVQPGRHLSDVSHAIGSRVESAGYAVLRKAHGHGVGENLHEDPQIPNYGPPGHGPRLREGMVLAIEPVVVAGDPATKLYSDGWTEVTRDGSLAAHFEHTVYVTNTGVEVLTALQRHRKSENAGLIFEQTGLTWRTKRDSDNSGILYLAKQQMDPILLEAWGRPVQPTEVLSTDPSMTYVLAGKQEEVHGFCVFSYRPPYLHLNTIVIDAGLQGKGIARHVMSLVEEEAQNAGMSGIDLWVQMNNHRAIRFYEKLGFVTIGQPYFRTWAMRKRF